MRTRDLFVTTLALSLACLSGCKDKPVSDSEADRAPGSTVLENIDPSEEAAAARLQPAKDPIDEEISAFRAEFREAYDHRRFDDLEQRAAKLRAAREVFGNGSWKILQFYNSFECRDDEPESMWELHDRIHQEWIAAKPESITACVAYADFLTGYAWQARGSGYAGTVTEKGWALFGERLASAREVLAKGRQLPDKDPIWWLTALRVALGKGWPPG
ncbi:MAG: DUF4034 domain-containing protein [Verrucomicrobiota bacterium]|nr:DUF4034 domain-containing protein [Verrucomicrobiota bacterium]